MDITALRADIKSWERAFRTENQRNPTIDDIKALPKIAAKYKLYKKLYKETTSQPQEKINGAEPSTPPRNSSSLPGSSSLVPKSRPVTHTATEETANPFSPTKSSRSNKMIYFDELPFPQPNLTNNPSTPCKKRQFSTPSLEPFPPIAAVLEPTSPEINSAVKKARKRLRGDLVSPSPKKPRMSQMPVSSASEEDLDRGEADAPYVTESPVKVSTNGKNFKPIFEEGRLPQPIFVKRGPFSKSMTDPFGSLHSESKVGSSSSQNQHRKASALRNVKKGPPQTMKPMPATKCPSTSPKPTSKEHSPTTGITEDSRSNQSRKRSSSFDAEELNFNGQFPSLANVLLPPSPPNASQTKSKISVKGTARDRKKPKLASSCHPAENVSDDEPELEVIELESLPPRTTGSQRFTNDDDDDDETVRETFGFRMIGQSNSDPEAEENKSDGDEPEMNLPEDLRSVLHISASHRSAREERALVEALLQGRPGPSDQRGEVWGIGECEDAAANTTDDEWVGEGVPWEVGEL